MKTTTKLQVGLASAVLAAAATVTPLVAHAAPTSGDGNSASSSDPGDSSNSGPATSDGDSSNSTNPSSRTRVPRRQPNSGTSGSDTPAAGRPRAGAAVPVPTPSVPSDSAGSSDTAGSGSTAPGDTRAPAPSANSTANADTLGPIGNLVKVTVQVGAQVTWGFLDTTAGVLKLVGEFITTIPIIGPAIGNAFIVVSDALHNAAYAVATTFKVGPYLNS